jgi:trehalose/maltose hydrolase-like predicted phosphorylase
MSAGGLHIGAAAGAWQAMLFGFLGISVEEGTMRIDPCLPVEWPELNVRFQCLGTTVEVTVRDGHGDVRSAHPIRVRRPGDRQARELATGTRLDLGRVIPDA